MIIPIKKILLESFTEGTLLHEIRYILTISDSDFNKLPPKLCTREDWYFKDYRIRKYNCKQKNQFQWIKIMNSSSGLVKKKSITIKEPSKEELQKADLYLNIVSKRPIIKGKELYLEKVNAYKDNKKISFYSTEAETQEGINNIKLLKEIGVTKIQQVKEKSLKDLTLVKLQGNVMKIPIKQILLEAIQRHTYNQNNIEMSPEDHIRNTNNLYKNLNQFSKEYNIPKRDLVVFGSSALGIQGLRTPNDLDIGIRKEYIPLLKQNFKPVKGSYGTQYDIDKLSFVHELAVPKYNGGSLFDQKTRTYKGVPTITFDQWQEMQRNDPLQKDKQYLR